MPHLAPSQTSNLSKPASGPASQGGNSPASLLWAHQLRREHKSLVSRVDSLEGKIRTSNEAIEARECSTTARMDGLREWAGELRAEMGDIKRNMEKFKKEREKEEEQRRETEKGDKERRDEFVEKIKAEIGGEIKELEEAVKELKDKMDKGVPYPPHLIAEKTTMQQDYGTPPSAQPLQATMGKWDSAIPSTVSGTPTSTRHVDSERLPQSSPYYINSLTQLSPRHDSAKLGQASPILGSTPKHGAAPHSDGSHDILAGLIQGDRLLSSYLELGESVLVQFPRRRDEAKVVERFWIGLADLSVRDSVEVRLESEGWTWNVLREAVHELLGQFEGQNPKEQRETARKGKKKRFIPIVWSVEEE